MVSHPRFIITSPVDRHQSDAGLHQAACQQTPLAKGRHAILVSQTGGLTGQIEGIQRLRRIDHADRLLLEPGHAPHRLDVIEPTTQLIQPTQQ